MAWDTCLVLHLDVVSYSMAFVILADAEACVGLSIRYFVTGACERHSECRVGVAVCGKVACRRAEILRWGGSCGVQDRCTPLHLAAQKGFLELAERLIAAKVRIDPIKAVRSPKHDGRQHACAMRGLFLPFAL